jgi:hypothetical protein
LALSGRRYCSPIMDSARNASDSSMRRYGPLTVLDNFEFSVAAGEKLKNPADTRKALQISPEDPLNFGLDDVGRLGH